MMMLKKSFIDDSFTGQLKTELQYIAEEKLSYYTKIITGVIALFADKGEPLIKTKLLNRVQTTYMS